MSTLKQIIQARARKFHIFTSRGGGVRLRPYQRLAAAAVLHSIRNRLGFSIVLIFARQSGKDELAANLKAYLLARYAHRDASIVEVNPTYKPQTINAISRLEDRLSTNLITRLHWRKRHDFMRVVGTAKATFLSGEGSASVVGATASLLLIVNEAQDILPSVYDKKLAPMAASANATRLFMGTSWTSRTLLARELSAARAAEKQDSIRRVFIYDADQVRKFVPAYGTYVDGEIARLGRQHPLVKSQYFCEEIDAQSGMFHAARLALINSDSFAASLQFPSSSARLEEDPKQSTGTRPIAFLIDVAGQDELVLRSPVENAALQAPGRDSTALSIVEIDLSTLRTLHSPTYRVVRRFSWTGQNHLSVLGDLMALAEQWRPQHFVIDATGVGEGLWTMLDDTFPTRVMPVKFTQQQKSEIGWRFLAIIETGRFRDRTGSSPVLPPAAQIAPSPGIRLVHADAVRLQYANCISEILPGPAKTLRWGVPEGTRGPHGELIHDDFVIADSLVAVLDRLDWRISVVAAIAHAPDPLGSMSASVAPQAVLPRFESLTAGSPHQPAAHDPLDEMSRIH
jgi:hypothetical protein